MYKQKMPRKSQSQVIASKTRRNNFYLTYIHSDIWRKKSYEIRKLTGNRCVVFPWLLARHSHHLHYKNLGKELPIRDCVPVSKIAHWFLHWDLFWKLLNVRAIVNLYLRTVCVFIVIPLGFIWRKK